MILCIAITDFVRGKVLEGDMYHISHRCLNAKAGSKSLHHSRAVASHDGQRRQGGYIEVHDVKHADNQTSSRSPNGEVKSQPFSESTQTELQ